MTLSLSKETINPQNNKVLIKEVFEDSEINEINKKIEFINSSIFNIGNSKPTKLTDYIKSIEANLGKKANVILGLDQDAIEKTMKIAKNLKQYGIDVKITQHEGKDFGDMTKDEVIYYLQSAKKYELTDRIGYLIESISSGSIF